MNLKTITNTFKKPFVTLFKRVDNFVLNISNKHQLKTLLVNVPAQHKTVYKTVLENQQTWFDRYSAHALPHLKRKERKAQKKFILNIVVRALNGIKNIFKVVGAQPLQSPVGLVYTMQYAHKDGRPLTAAELQAPLGNTLTLSIIQRAVEAGARKLQASWSLELVQDLKQHHDFDVEKELMGAMGSEVAHEIISEITNDLFKLAQSNPEITVDPKSTPTFEQSLMIALHKAAVSVGRKTHRGMGNFIITSPMGIAMLQGVTSPRLKLSDNPTSSASFSHIGDLVYTDDKPVFKVFCATTQQFLSNQNLMPDEVYFLVGYKGTSEVDTPYVYSPYVMMVDGGIVVNPHTFQPQRTFSTRYGKCATDSASNYYTLVKCALPASPNQNGDATEEAPVEKIEEAA